MKEEIIKLTDLWYQIISTEHHKDRDCHWYINTVYSYGNPPVFRVEHYGYIGGDLSGEYETYDRAEHALVGMLKVAIHEARKWAEKVLATPKETKLWDSAQYERAASIKKLTD